MDNFFSTKKNVLKMRLIKTGCLNSHVCVSGGKKCLFFRNFGVLCFLETPVLRFALLPYYRRIKHKYFSSQFLHSNRNKTLNKKYLKNKKKKEFLGKYLSIYSKQDLHPNVYIVHKIKPC